MEILPIDEIMAEEAILKEMNALHKEKVDMLKAQAVANGTPMRSKLFGLNSGGIDLVEGKPSEPFVRYSLTDPDAVIDWMDETRPETDGFAQDNLEAFCQWHFEHTGELPPGFDRYTGMTEEKPITARFTARKPQQIIEAIGGIDGMPQRVLGGLLGAESARLLEGGEPHDG